MLQSSDAWPLVRWVLGAQLILSALAMLVTLLVSTAI